MTLQRRRPSPDLVIILVLLVVHFTLYRFFVRWPAMPNLMIGALFLGALRLQAGYAAAFGFGLGILEAAMGLEGLGTISVVLTIVGYLGARSRDLLFADARYYVFFYLFAGTWVAELSLMLALPGGPQLLEALVLAPVSALGTAIICAAAESLAGAFRRP